jgi:hypothetical protein
VQTGRVYARVKGFERRGQMNATALCCCSRFWYFFKLAIIGFGIGVLIYFMWDRGSYACQNCGEKAWGKPELYFYSEGYGKFQEHQVRRWVEVCGRCFTELNEWDKKIKELKKLTEIDMRRKIKGGLK